MGSRAKIYEVAFQIGGKMDRSFSGSMLNAQKNLNMLNHQVTQLSNAQSGVNSFRKLKNTISSTERDLKKAKETVAGLSRELINTEKPTRKMKSEFERARKGARKLKDRLLDQRTQLSKLRTTLNETGTSTRNLAADNTALESRLNRTRLAQQKLNQVLLKQKALGNKRNGHQSRIFEAAGTGAAMAAPIVFPIKKAIDFESAMADVRKTVNFDTPEGFTEFSKMIAAMPRTARIPLKQEELAAIAAAGGQLGIVEKNLPAFIQSTSKMSIAFDMTADRAGEAAAKLSNVYDIPISAINNLGDAVNHLSDNTAAKAYEMVDVLLRMGGTAKNLELTAVQSAALGNAMVALGKQPEIAGTSITFMLSKLATVDKQGAKFNDALNLMGMSADDLKDKLGNDAQGAILEFLESIEKVEKADRHGVIVDLFGEEQAKHISTLVGGLDKYRSALKLINKQSAYAGSMDKEFINRSKTRANNLKILFATASEAAINFGTVLFPAVDLVTRGLGALASKAAVFAEQHPVLTKYIGLTGAAAAGTMGLVAAVSAGGYVVTFLQGGILSLSKAYLLLKNSCLLTQIQLTALAVSQKIGAVATGVMTAAQWALNAALSANPIVLVGAAIAGAAFLIYKYWEPLKTFFSGFWQGMASGLQPVISLVQEIYNQVKPLFSVFAPIGKFFVDLFKPVSMSNQQLAAFSGWGMKVGKVFSYITKAALFPFIGALKAISFAGKIIGKISEWFSENEDVKGPANIPNDSKVMEQVRLYNQSYGLNNPVPATQLPQAFNNPEPEFKNMYELNKEMAVSHTNNNQKKELNLNFAPVISIPPGVDKSVVESINKSLSTSHDSLKEEWEQMMKNENRINF